MPSTFILWVLFTWDSLINVVYAVAVAGFV